MSPHIDRVAVVGCGLIGSGWASGFLAKGLEVTCTDPARSAEARLKNSVSASLAELGHSQADCQQGPGPRWAATGPFVSHELAGGEGGGRQTFANLGEAMSAKWADLGSPSLTPQLEACVVAALRDCMAEKSQRRWGEERRRLVRAIQQAKALIESEASSL